MNQLNQLIKPVHQAAPFMGRHSCRHSRQSGMATLMATVILLIVATLSALMVARSAFFEQNVTGSDIRNKEVYASAITGLDYAVQGLIVGDEVWSDLGAGAVGATATPAAPGDTAQYVDTYSVVNGGGQLEYELMTDYDESLTIVKVTSTAAAVGDNQVNKTVEVLALRADLINPTIVNGPPLVVENCIDEAANFVGGTPNIYPASICLPVDPADPSICQLDGSGDPIPSGDYEMSIASTSDGECVHEGHFDSFDENGDPIDMVIGEALNDNDSFYYDFFSMPIQTLEQMADAAPQTIIFVDNEYPSGNDYYTAYNGNAWHESVGTDDNQVILFFAKEVGCPAISGGAGSPTVAIHGLVFYEQPDCDLSGWGNAQIYGTLAVSGDLTQFNANVELYDVDLDSFGGDNTETKVVSLIPGSWRDFD